VFRVGPGQITDDSELALCLARALITRAPANITSGPFPPDAPPPAGAPLSAGDGPSRGSEPAAEPGSGGAALLAAGAAGAAREGYWEGRFPLGRVARAYHWWAHSQPFDIGGTCATAFRFPLTFQVDTEIVLSTIFPPANRTPEQQAEDEERMRQKRRQMQEEDEKLLVKQMQTNAATCSDSQANGALMRATPLAVWAHRLPPEAVARWAALDASLSHCNPVCRAANAAYCVAIAHLINHPGDAEGAFEGEGGEAGEQEDRGGGQGGMRHTQGNVASKHSGSRPCGLQVECRRSIGWVKWGFMLAFYHLLRGSGYEEAIEDTLVRGGDTDTNAAIVGGMVGAMRGVEGMGGMDGLKEVEGGPGLEGEKGVPRGMVEGMVRRDYSKGRERPEQLRPRDLLALCEALFHLAPGESAARSACIG
ncbi:hypothetical protein CLOM_g8678, partial [Closterium sp. NIES-68]